MKKELSVENLSKKTAFSKIFKDAVFSENPKITSKKFEDFEKSALRAFTEIFKNATSSKNPQIFLSGGQPASGKGKLISHAEKILQSQKNSYIIINGDDYRIDHPDSLALYKEFDKEYATKTDDFTRPFTKAVFDYARGQKCNIIFEGTMRTDAIFKTITDMRNEGYQAHISVISNNKLNSKLGIYERYYNQKDKNDIARFTSAKSHDDAYKGMLYVLNKFEKEKNFETLTVYNNNLKPLYENDKTKAMPYKAVDILNKERDKEWTPQEMSIYNKRINSVLKQMEKYKEAPQHIAIVKMLRTQCLQYSSEKQQTLTKTKKKGLER